MSDAGYTGTLEALLAATYRLSGTVGTGQAADVLAETACALMGADGAHVHLPEEPGAPIWANANAACTPAARGTVTFHVAADGPDLRECLATGKDFFVADGLAADALRRPLRARLGTASLWFIPLVDVGVLVLWWTEPRAAPPAFAGDWFAFVTHVAQGLRRRIVTTSLQDLSRTDPLTGLDNRRVLMEVLSSLPAGGGLLLVDLDHFKLVNDTFGHRHGDQVLQSFAGLLQGLGPRVVSVARFGGEEFAVVLAADAHHTGEQVFAELQRSWHGQAMAFSAGVAVHREGARPEETLEAADRAMYRPKRAGRDRLVHAADLAWAESAATTGPLIVSSGSAPEDTAPDTPPGALAGCASGGDAARSVVGEAGLSLDELDAALGGGLVTVYYQPVVDTRTGRVAAVEALARITHPSTGAVVLPARFLPLAERSGRVRELDRQVAAAAITQLAMWREDPQMGGLRVAVNVSVDNLGDHDLPTFLSDQCGLAGVPTDAVVVEITETLQSVTGRHHEDVVQRLRDAGLQVALDDFGTGFSALSYLLRFPVTAIKVDMSFTAALADERGRYLVQGIVSTALRMGLSVIAEGVETAAQRDWLTAQGCPFVQGYLLSPPLPAAYLSAAVGQLNPRSPAAASSLGRRG